MKKTIFRTVESSVIHVLEPKEKASHLDQRLKLVADKESTSAVQLKNIRSVIIKRKQKHLIGTLSFCIVSTPFFQLVLWFEQCSSCTAVVPNDLYRSEKRHQCSQLSC
jgi:hypothetical protein